MPRVRKADASPIQKALMRALKDRLAYREIAPSRWAVSSATHAGMEHEIIWRYGDYVCSCQASVTLCKHIALVRFRRGEITSEQIIGDDRYIVELAQG